MMTGTIVTAVIAGGSAVAGGALVARSNWLINWRQAKDARQRGLRDTFVALVSALSQIDHQLRTEPKSRRTVRAINEQMATRFPQVDYITGRLHRRLFQPELDELVVRFHDAMAATLLIAPPELIPVLDALNVVMVQVDQYSDVWWRSWDEARADLVRACRVIVSEPIPAADQPAMPVVAAVEAGDGSDHARKVIASSPR